eukprot:3659450-Rhodomonas_salina.1
MFSNPPWHKQGPPPRFQTWETASKLTSYPIPNPKPELRKRKPTLSNSNPNPPNPKRKGGAASLSLMTPSARQFRLQKFNAQAELPRRDTRVIAPAAPSLCNESGVSCALALRSPTLTSLGTVPPQSKTQGSKNPSCHSGGLVSNHRCPHAPSQAQVAHRSQSPSRCAIKYTGKQPPAAASPSHSDHPAQTVTADQRRHSGLGRDGPRHGGSRA